MDELIILEFLKQELEEQRLAKMKVKEKDNNEKD